jgi:hypothetical protein
MDNNLVINVVKTIIESFNSKNNIFFELWQPYSKLIYNNNILSGDDIKKFFLELNCNIIVNKYDHHIIGDRRANILLSGYLTPHNKNMSMYILLAIDNHKKYWIHSAIFQIH